MPERTGDPAIRSEDVKRANLEVYNRKTLEDYDENRSIFHPARQKAIREILGDLRRRTGGGAILDLGCGTGNLLRIAKEEFSACIGLDLAHRLLERLRSQEPRLLLVSGDSERLPFSGDSFDAIALYAVLHHILDPVLTFREIFRCLKPGGYLYTDHDPNFFFNRFYHLYYRMRHSARPGFGSRQEEIAEYHNTQSRGLNPEAIGKKLREAGFACVSVHYRHTNNDDLPFLQLLVLKSLRRAARIFPFRSLYTHFWILARK